ncbi:hypothetical protein NDU88_006128 [Pleurodeles waltl]|uniref:Uncharacterized protein n=1 Tax=Pleurodeles waltl TaxID=8319 RepID=A0AAV7WDT0_PLEWA|nr:hypothetical protein NDU88_006128 [Pleurodeles waltl]
MGTLSDVRGVEFRKEDLQVTMDHTTAGREAEKDALEGERRTDTEAEGDSGPLPRREENKAVAPGEGEAKAQGTRHDLFKFFLCFLFRHSREDQGPEDRRT